MRFRSHRNGGRAICILALRTVGCGRNTGLASPYREAAGRMRRGDARPTYREVGLNRSRSVSSSIWVPTPFVAGICGLLILALEFTAYGLNTVAVMAYSKSSRRWLRSATWVSGIGLALLSLKTPAYTAGPQARAFGVPFLIVGLQFRDGHWVDYPAIFAPLAIVANAVVAAMIPQLLIFAGRKLVPLLISR
jgi:hypothetical protein